MVFIVSESVGKLDGPDIVGNGTFYVSFFRVVKVVQLLNIIWSLHRHTKKSSKNRID